MTRFDPEYFEALESDLVAREAKDRRDEVLARCEQREEARRAFKTSSRKEAVSKSEPARQRDQPMSHDWENYITREIDKAEQHVLQLSMEVIGETLAKMRADLRREFEAKLEAEVMKLRNEFLQDRLDQERGVKRSPLKVVPTDGMVG